MSEENPVVVACMELDGKGGGKTVAREDLKKPATNAIVMLSLHKPEDVAWLENEADLEPSVIDGLLAHETRPRFVPYKTGVLVVLRGVNTNPGSEPEDMVAIRMWVSARRVIGVQRRRLLSLQDIVDEIDKGVGPTTTGEFLAVLVERLADRIGDFVETVEDEIEESERKVAERNAIRHRASLSATRREVASVRRYLFPQRDALDRLYRQKHDALTEKEANALREQADRITRYLEDLDLARERAVVLQEELLAQIAMEQNERMYLLSIVAAIFLPLGFVTGLFGINIGGLPGIDDPAAFMKLMFGMIGTVSVLFAIFRYKKWL